MAPRISIIAAVAEDGAIGRDGRLPWRIPDDLHRFRRLTTGHPVIMGRRTHEAIGRPLPERLNIVISRNPTFRSPGCVVVGSLEDAVAVASAHDDEEVFVIGGAEVFAPALAIADRLYLTLVAGQFAGDTFFPDYARFGRVVFEQEGVSGGHRYRFVDLER